jgi:hypothetical protein
MPARLNALTVVRSFGLRLDRQAEERSPVRFEEGREEVPLAPGKKGALFIHQLRYNHKNPFLLLWNRRERHEDQKRFGNRLPCKNLNKTVQFYESLGFEAKKQDATHAALVLDGFPIHREKRR